MVVVAGRAGRLRRLLSSFATPRSMYVPTEQVKAAAGLPVVPIRVFDIMHLPYEANT